MAVGHGITLQNVSLPGLHIGTFYIKLDKKLIINADDVSLNLPADTNRTNLESIKDLSRLLSALPRYFDLNDIKAFSNNHQTFHQYL
jgi:hypothetical protein